ncbi:iron-containing redox enzyme family protein [Nocardia sp. NPDC060249]|uniref:iron-containing redox enzyme family protein n=1 Tax=Nocardia sp. NPDC060249 TaxID=3347082 RepID=UPI00365F0ED0
MGHGLEFIDDVLAVEGGGESRVGFVEGVADALFADLDYTISRMWGNSRKGKLWTHVEAHGFDRELYRLLMVQIYHYTSHNATNQAVAAFRATPAQLSLLKFVLEHAREELGHERMVLHDLRAVGLLEKGQTVDDRPLPATDALIGYLYGVALREGPIARLGYSYWAEAVYEHIAPLMAVARESLGLTDRDMSFFVAHAEIDTKHADEVREAIRKSVHTPEQAEGVLRVASTTLSLTHLLMDQAFEAWEATTAVPA